ncbi:MAG: anti-sigma factor domain-containing protein [Desulfotomaculaceae bacterium]
MKIKGTVLEINPDTALVMTAECDFVEIHRLEGLETGQEIVFSRRDIVGGKGRRISRVTLALVACLALFFICVPVYISYFTGTAGAAVAYVSVDINPSLELAVNDRSLVLEAAAFNHDGDKLLQSVSVHGKPVTEAVTALIQAAEEMHYLIPDGQDQVLVCLAPADAGNKNAELLSNIGTDLADLEKVKTAKIKIVGTTEIQHREAQQVGMSAGRYTLWEENAKSDQGKLEQYKNGKLADVIAEPKDNGKVNRSGPQPGNGNGNGNEKGNGTPQNQKPELESRPGARPAIPPGLEKKNAPGLESRGQDLEHENKLEKDKGQSTGQREIDNNKKDQDVKNKDSSWQEKRSMKANK